MMFVSKVARAAIEERVALEGEQERRLAKARGLADAAWCRMADESARPDAVSEPSPYLMLQFKVSHAIRIDAFTAAAVRAADAAGAFEASAAALIDDVDTLGVTMRELREAILSMTTGLAGGGVSLLDISRPAS